MIFLDTGEICDVCHEVVRKGYFEEEITITGGGYIHRRVCGCVSDTVVTYGTFDPMARLDYDLYWARIRREVKNGSTETNIRGNAGS